MTSSAQVREIAWPGHPARIDDLLVCALLEEWGESDEDQAMRLPAVDIVTASEVRQALVADGDIRAEIEFQNDVNAILRELDGGVAQWQALSGPSAPKTREARIVKFLRRLAA